MTDTTPMRERLARALCRSMGQPEEIRTVGSKAPPRQNWERYLPQVDALLDALETPSEEMRLAGMHELPLDAVQFTAPVFTAMVKAIRGGA